MSKQTDAELTTQLDSCGNILNDGMYRAHSSDYIARSSKVITLVDLAGHERYFKTTAYGLTGHMPGDFYGSAQEV